MIKYVFLIAFLTLLIIFGITHFGFNTVATAILLSGPLLIFMAVMMVFVAYIYEKLGLEDN